MNEIINYIKNYDIQKIEELINNMIDIESVGGHNALIYASKYNYIQIVELLLKSDININSKDKYGWTPLMYAATFGRKEIVNLLIEKGADINIQNDIGWTALSYALNNDHEEIIKLLNVKNIRKVKLEKIIK